MQKCLNKHLLFLLALVVLSLSFANVLNPHTAMGDGRVQISARLDQYAELRLGNSKSGQIVQALTNMPEGVSLIVDGEILKKQYYTETIALRGRYQLHPVQQVLLVPQY